MKNLTILFLLLVMQFAALSAYDFYVVNSESQVMSVVNSENGTIDPDFAMLGADAYAAPNRMEILDGKAYVTITYENTLQVIDLDNDRDRTSIYLGDNVLPYDVCAGNGYLWITGSASEKLYQIDPADNEITGTVDVGIYPQSVLYRGGILYVSNSGYTPSDMSYAPGTVTVIDAQTCAVLATIDTDLNPQDIAAYNGLLHLTCTGDYFNNPGVIDIIDPNTYEVVDVLEIGGSPGSIVASADGRMYVGNAWPAGVYVYDATSLNVLITPDDGIFLGGNALDIFGTELLSVDGGDYIQNSDVYRYNLSNQSLIASYEVAVGATDVLIDPSQQSVDDGAMNPVAEISLRVFPNPARMGSQIRFSMPEGISVDNYLIYDVKGRQIAKIKGGSWDGNDSRGKAVGSGVYFCVSASGNKRLAVTKMTIVR